MENEFDYLMPANIALLIGAGTSCHMTLCGNDKYRVPIDSTFYLTAKEISNWCKDETIESLGVAAIHCIAKALASHGVDENELVPGKSGGPEVSMEDAFCRLEMLRMLGIDTNHGGWPHAADAFRDLIAIVTSQGRLPDNNLDGGYHGLVRRLQAEGLTRKIAILTLNYELGIEQAIVRHVNEDRSAYRSEWSRWDASGSIMHGDVYYYHLPNRSFPQGEALKILKLHGSCNWGYCPDCKNVQWFMERNGSLDVTKLLSVGNSGGRCSWHSVDDALRPYYTPHIVAPTWNKWMGDYTLRHIWRGTHNVLKSIDALFVVGTSLPPTDSHVRHLLSATVSPAARSTAPVVYVVNKSGSPEYLDRLSTAVGQKISDDPDLCKWAGFEEPDTINWIIERAKRHIVTGVKTTISY